MKNKISTNEQLFTQIHTQQKKIKSLEKKVALQSQIEESLKTSENNLSAILEKNADGIIIVDMYGTVLYVNPAAEKLFGKSKEGFLDYPFGFPVSTDESENSLVIKKGDTYCEVELRVVQMHWQKQSAFQLSVRDITELKKANLIIETRKKERYGRYLSYVYYSHDHKDFEGIIRNGKMLNEELVKAGLAAKYNG